MVTYSKEAVAQIGADIAFRRSNKCKCEYNKDKNIKDRTFRAFYGRSADDVQEIWEAFYPHIVKPELKHLFWTLMYLKLYLPIDVMVVMLHTCNTTFDRQVWKWVYGIASRRFDFIKWEKRNRNLPNHRIWCRVTIDGTDFRIGEPVPFNKKWKSPKAKGASVKYEVAVSIYSGDIVWIYGPHVGSKHDLTIFREELLKLLDKDEMVETDAGYRGEAEFIRNKHDFENDQEDKEKSELRARQETVNRRFKQWGILQERFRNDKQKHQMAFYAIATLTQMDIDKGNVLFSVGVTALQRKRNYKF